MKVCPKCQAQNDDQAAFCEQCGYHFTEEEAVEPATQAERLQTETKPEPTAAVASRRTTEKTGNKVPWLVGGIIVLLGVVLGLSLYLFLGNSKPAPTATSSTQMESTAKSQSNTAESSTEEDELTKYDDIITEAKKLTIAGKYKESELQLAAIPVSALAQDKYSTIRSAIEDLNAKNAAGMNQQAAKDTQGNAGGNSTFVGDFAKWANTYTFYYSQEDQIQSTLTISANGGVTQNNYDGTQYFGKAVITSADGEYLSYETNELYPGEMPATKMIEPNVTITIDWDNGGGSQVYYGYLSYSSRLALTDGREKGAGVNEVWISY